MPGLVKMDFRVVIMLWMMILPALRIQAQADTICPEYQYMKETVDTGNFHLMNEARLYYRFNCDSIWLTYDNGISSRVLYVNDIDLHNYSYRLFYQFQAEFHDFILFRYGCPANGPCLYDLVHKKTGAVTQTFDALVYTGHLKEANFIIGLSDPDKHMLIIYDINHQQVDSIYMANANVFQSIIPTQEFQEPIIEGNRMSLRYYDWVDAPKDGFTVKEITFPVEKYRMH